MQNNTDYNDIFERLVALDAEGHVDPSQEHIVGFVAYGLYKQSKREWMHKTRQDCGKAPSSEEITAYTNHQKGPSQLKRLLKDARGILGDFQQAAVDLATPDIQKTTLKDSFWPGVRQSMTAAALYTMGLVLLSFILAFLGVDLLAVFEVVRGIAGK